MAKLPWISELQGSTQALMEIHDSQGSLNIGDKVQDWSVSEIRKALGELDAEMVRLKTMEDAVIHTKKQIKSAILKGIE